MRTQLAPSRLINRNVDAIAGRTSMRLEPEVWDALREICIIDDVPTLGDLIKRIEAASPGTPRTSAVRVYALEFFRRRAGQHSIRAAA